METRQLTRAAVELAPDGSEIRRLLTLPRASFAHCTLHPAATSKAICHRNVEEIWFVLEGRGQLWRKASGTQHVVDLAPGLCVSIPATVHFQFRNVGEQAMQFVLCTMPPWPGPSEAIRVADYWPS